MDPAHAGRSGHGGKRLAPEQRHTYYLLWRELGIRPSEVADIPDWELAIAVRSLLEWVPMLQYEPSTGSSTSTAAGGGTPTRTIPFAQAVAEGIIPPSGDAMTGPVDAPQAMPVV